MAAAVTLAEAGVTVTVYEAGTELGGRARRVVVNDTALDNGQHILLGAYTETLRLIRAVHPEPASALQTLPLDWQMDHDFRVRAVPLPAPFHLAFGLLAAQGAPMRERIAAVRFMAEMRKRQFRLPRDLSVAALLAEHRQGPAISKHLWVPMCVSALNTRPEVASAQVFVNVLRDAFHASRAASEVLLARVDLSSLFPVPAAEYVCRSGGNVIAGTMVSHLQEASGFIAVHTRDGEEQYDAVVCAVSPHRAADLFGHIDEMEDIVATLERFRYQPIYTAFLKFSEPVHMPASMLGVEGTAQWLFDRGAIANQPGIIAGVISAEGDHQRLTLEQVAERVRNDIDRLIGRLPPLAWHRVIAEKRATFECAVGVERPSTQTPLANLHLAGDYTASDYPATIEAAIRSGVAAAHQALHTG